MQSGCTVVKMLVANTVRIGLLGFRSGLGHTVHYMYVAPVYRTDSTFNSFVLNLPQGWFARTGYLGLLGKNWSTKQFLLFNFFAHLLLFFCWITSLLDYQEFFLASYHKVIQNLLHFFYRNLIVNLTSVLCALRVTKPMMLLEHCLASKWKD